MPGRERQRAAVKLVCAGVSVCVWAVVASNESCSNTGSGAAACLFPIKSSLNRVFVGLVFAPRSNILIGKVRAVQHGEPLCTEVCLNHLAGCIDQS